MEGWERTLYIIPQFTPMKKLLSRCGVEAGSIALVARDIMTAENELRIVMLL
jgi:hypothetical protein